MNTARPAAAPARILLLLLAACALLGDFLSPVPATDQDLERVNAPPTLVHFWDAGGKWHWRPFVYRYEAASILDSIYEEKKDRQYPLRFFCPGYRYRLLGFFPSDLHLVCATGFHPLGSDDLGRDVLARLLAGAQTSLAMVAVGLLLYSVLGVAVGALSGFGGRWMDSLLMRFAEFVLALPALYLILALRAVIPSSLPFWQTLLLTAGVISCIAWPPMARAVRGLILQLRNAPYVEAARCLGCSEWEVFRRHMLPALPAHVAAQAVVAAPLFLLGEVVLSFLDVGFHEGADSWGSMLRSVKDPRVLTDFWWNLSPLGMVFLALLGLNAVSRSGGDGSPTRL
jgi:peptide/nickel transport system permease protein